MKIIELSSPITLQYVLQVEKERVANRDKEAVAIIYTGTIQGGKETVGLYARKSQESEERQVQSIEWQLVWWFTQVEVSDLQLKIVIIETKSAKEPWREWFNHLMWYYNTWKEDHIICWELNRLSRNPVDEWVIKWLVQRWLVKTIISTNGVCDGSNILAMSMYFGMATQYIIDLKKNVARWVQQKIEKWWCVWFVPRWYRNNKETNEPEIVWDCTWYVKKAFQMRAKKFSYRVIWEELFKLGFKNKKWKSYSAGSIQNMITNKFYIWLAKYSWVHYEASHEIFITKKLWDKANADAQSFTPIENSREAFPFKWIIKNFHTKRDLTVEWKKNKTIIHYVAGSRYDKAIRVRINQNDIIQAFEDKIWDYILPKKLEAEFMKWCHKYYKELLKENKRVVQVFQRKKEQLQIKIDGAFDLYCERVMTLDAYKKKVNKMEIQVKEIDEEIKSHGNVDAQIKEEACKTIALLCNLTDKRKNASSNEKILIIKFIVVALYLDNKKQLHIEENELFKGIKKYNCTDWQGQ